MMSILSNSQVHKNNTMTLIKNSAGHPVHGRAGLSSLGPNTTIYGEESLVENGEIEELHYLMVRVEKMKKTMLGKVEGRIDVSQLAKDRSGNIINVIDEKEEALYRNSDPNGINGDIGGGDASNSAQTSMIVAQSNIQNQLAHMSQDHRNSRLNQNMSEQRSLGFPSNDYKQG
jgi:hypothetical protein